MTAYRVPAALLHQIEQELDLDEKETMLFLCRDLIPEGSEMDVRKLFVALNEKEMLAPLGLPELLYRVKRFDLLKKLLNMGRAAVESSLARCPPMVSRYRVLMSEINEDLDKDDLSSLVFLLMSERGGSHMKMAKDKSFLSIVVDLEKRDRISPGHLDLIEDCFRHIHRNDLVKRIQKYKWEVSAPVHPISAPPVYGNTLQASFPKLSLADPPLITEKRRSLNGECPPQAEQVHISIPETGGAPAQVLKKYRMQSQPLGVCLIIDCIGNDAAMLADTFRALRFEVHCHLFLNVDSMVRELHTAARLKEHKDYDCFVCILVSRGDHQNIFCTDQLVPGFPLERVKSFFTGGMCNDLLGKPKLFFIQNYIESGGWQDDTSLVEADGDLCTIPQVADILWSQSMVDASALEKSPGSSSYYLTALAKLLTDPHKRKFPLLDILVELNNRVYERNRTNPTELYSLFLKHTLRKKLFLSTS
ncbi:CASP8 and FADD-like apoptosis regulator isoform X1 [Pogona vitticeps]|nr:CASP8 and FADD-like apoptosis regulator isoform X1 [Pogona vitticeps]XP_020667409.1 CASP8 and FADD-like apoptosis regulator isoform X1 [Pogona vitticeps]